MITKHSKERIFERVGYNYTKEAKRLEKQAWATGKHIHYYKKYPKFFASLQRKRDKTGSNKVRVYQNYIFIWRGSNPRKLVTVIPINNEFLKEMERIDNND